MKKKKLIIYIIIVLISILIIYIGTYIYINYFHLNEEEKFIYNALNKEAEQFKVVAIIKAKKCYKNFGKLTIQYEDKNGGLYSETKYIYNNYVIDNPENIICYEPINQYYFYNKSMKSGLEIINSMTIKEKKENEENCNIIDKNYDHIFLIKNTCNENSINISKNGINKINRLLKKAN